MENLTIKVNPGQQELIIREGAALDQRECTKIVIAGDISTVKEFLSKRLSGAAMGLSAQTIDKGTAVITVDEEKLFIKLELNPNDDLATEVIAKLEFTNFLEQFKINGKTTFSLKELKELLKFSKLLFDDGDEYETVYKAYQTFDFQAFVKASQEDDNRGNRAASFKKDVKTNLPPNLKLRIPIFKGQKPETFLVDICLDTTEANCRFWFESVELHNIIEQRKIEIFIEQLADFQDFVIIRK